MGVGSESWEAGGGQALGNEGDILLPAQPVPVCGDIPLHAHMHWTTGPL